MPGPTHPIDPNEGRAFACLKCDVTWVGAKECWMCGDTNTFIIGRWALEYKLRNGRPLPIQYEEMDIDPLG